MSCSKGNQSVNFYFFENGIACNPERVRKLRCEAAKVICKKGKTYSYKGKNLYTLNGEPVCSFNPATLQPSVAYVLVPGCETFMFREYDCAFQKALCERKAQARCKSLPMVTGGDCCPPKPKPCNVKSVCPKPVDSCCESCPSATNMSPCGQTPCTRASPSFGQAIQARGGGCPKTRPRRQENCNRSGLPCAMDDSDACIVCPDVPKINYKCKSRRPPTPMIKRKQTGFFASVCPCCVSKYKCQKLEARPVTSGCSPNAKLTQTTKEDFSMSRKRLQQAIREERQRQSLYSNRRRRNACKQRRDICPATDDEECDDPKKIMKREKAREQYCMKRRKMEQKLTKSLEKHYKKC